VCGAKKKMEREEEERKASLGSPLIHISEENEFSTRDGSNNERGINRKKVFEEVRKQVWLAGPLISVNLLLYSLQMISVMFVGHLGELALSGASMATSFATVTGFSLLVSCLFITFSIF
jgi:MATE family multidrug resistance protein